MMVLLGLDVGCWEVLPHVQHSPQAGTRPSTEVSVWSHSDFTGGVDFSADGLWRVYSARKELCDEASQASCCGWENSSSIPVSFSSFFFLPRLSVSTAHQTSPWWSSLESQRLWMDHGKSTPQPVWWLGFKDSFARKQQGRQLLREGEAGAEQSSQEQRFHRHMGLSHSSEQKVAKAGQ